MSWIRIDDNFPDHPKAIGLGSDERRFTWVRILAYTCRYRSPIVPANIGDVIPVATASFLRDCLALRLLDVAALSDVDARVDAATCDTTVYVVHDWHDYQAGNPKTAARQARYRAKARDVDVVVDDHVDAYVDGDVDAQVDGEVTPRARPARARPVPSRPLNDDYVVVEADDDVQAAMKRVGWSAGQRATAAKHEGAKVLALILKVEATPDVVNPAALAYQMLIDGQDPRNDRPKAGTGSTRAPVDAFGRCKRWIAGASWDETLSEELALEEFAGIYRRAELEPTRSQAAELLALWRTEHERRVLAATIAGVAS